MSVCCVCSQSFPTDNDEWKEFESHIDYWREFHIPNVHDELYFFENRKPPGVEIGKTCIPCLKKFFENNVCGFRGHYIFSN